MEVIIYFDCERKFIVLSCNLFEWAPERKMIVFLRISEVSNVSWKGMHKWKMLILIKYDDKNVNMPSRIAGCIAWNICDNDN